MLDFLLKVGIKEDTLDKLYNNLDESTLKLIRENYASALKTIIYMNKIGINNIDDVIIFNPDLLTKIFSKIRNKFNDKIISDINNDPSNIYEIYE